MKILFIACYSPMINNSASIETLQYLNNLVREGNQVHLLTVDFPENSVYYDKYIFDMLDKNIKLHIISGGKIFEKIMPKKSVGVVSKGKESSFKSILKKAKSIIAVPDMYYNWSRVASKYGIELTKKENFDVIFSMHEPPSSHICALKIKEEFRDIPWVTYWSDPWLKDSTRENAGRLRKKIESNLERKVVELSDRFVFVTKANRDDYIRSYGIPMEKTYIVTRGYDEEAYNIVKKESNPNKLLNNKVNLVYAGEIFSKLRDVKPFIAALNNIKAKEKEIFNKLNILFFGNIDSEEIKDKLISIENITVSPRIPYNEALGYIVKGDVLIIFGNKNSKQIPAKIYDYFGAEGRILVILGDENDPILDVIKDKEKCIVTNNNPKEIEVAIMKLVDMYNEDRFSGPIQEFEWKNISKRLNEILRG